MNLSFIDKIKMVFEYTFSSFFSVEMFILTILLFLVLIVSLKRNNYLLQMISIGIYIGFVTGILISYNSYVKMCFKSFIKALMNYVYFPSTIVYFFIIIFVTLMMIYTIFNKNISFFKKTVNYFFFSLLYFFFTSFIALAAYDSVDLIDISLLYQNERILSIVQISNFVLLIWIIFTMFYNLYLFFKKKYD